ncbi:hypothetical protein AbraIFM66950_008206 [Aspergillus brasiliensis]|nr:hypothetical protein AbraIFM66950_008206 [Aspergillus brasiliensis]
MATRSLLKGKVALITGASSGIGKATALALGYAGAQVMVADINRRGGEETALQIREATGMDATFTQTDVSQSESVRAMVQATVNTYGRLDIAINNAAKHPDSRPIASLDEDAWQERLQTNLTGVALSMKWELQQMISQSTGSSSSSGGSILNMASGTVFRAQENMAAYVVAKHGVVGLTQIAALENARYGIRVNALAPGGVSTDLTMSALAAMGQQEEQAAARVSLLGRFARPDEVGRAVVWLVSDEAAYMTGTTVPFDAGMSVM